MGSISRPLSPPSPVLFVPTEHLSYSPPSQIISLADIHLPHSPISPVASSVPFPLLSPSAILKHRAELFSSPVLSNCLWQKRAGSAQIRGMAPRYAPFITQFWTSPEVLSIISSIAGVDLVPVVEYEICHTNIQLSEDGKEGIRHTPVIPPEPTEEERVAFEKAKEVNEIRGTDLSTALIPWHRDSYPFVCVVMLSNAEFMTEGETELQKGDGTTMKIRAPQIGHAVVLQGRSVSHIALPAGNMKERITVVTSYRPRDVRLYDDSSFLNIRSYSQNSELYYQWTSYRLKLMSERFALQAEDLRARYEENVKKSDEDGKGGFCCLDTVNVDELRKWMAEQTKYMERTLYEMRPLTEEDNVLAVDIKANAAADNLQRWDTMKKEIDMTVVV